MEWPAWASIVVALAGAWVLLVGLLLLLRPRRVPLAAAARVVPDVARLVRSLLADPDTPAAVRASLVALLIWLVNPIDIVPEFVPVLGPLDDVIVTALVLRFVHRRLGDDELRRRWPGTPEGYALLSSILR